MATAIRTLFNSFETVLGSHNNEYVASIDIGRFSDLEACRTYVYSYEQQAFVLNSHDPEEKWPETIDRRWLMLKLPAGLYIKIYSYNSAEDRIDEVFFDSLDFFRSEEEQKQAIIPISAP